MRLEHQPRAGSSDRCLREVTRSRPGIPTLDGVRADLYLDFVGRKAWTAGVDSPIASSVAVTRTTTPAYARNSAGVYVPYSANTIRYDDILSGSLIEEGRTNFCLRSSELDNASWTKPADVTITADAITDIFGGSTMDMITCSGAGGGGLFQTITVTASTNYTWSFFARLGTLAASDYKFAVYDVSNAVFIGVNLVPSSTLTTTGTTRVAYTFTTPIGCTSIRVYPLRNSASIAGTVYVGQCQLEAGTFETSPIPTTTAAVARAADIMTCDQAVDFGPNGTMLIEWTGATAARYATNPFAAGLTNKTTPTANDRIGMLATTANASLAIYRSGASQNTFTSRAPVVATTNKLAAAWTSGRAVRALNNVLDVGTGAAGVPATVQDRLAVGSAPYGSGLYFNAVVTRLALWNSTRSDAAVQGATA